MKFGLIDEGNEEAEYTPRTKLFQRGTNDSFLANDAISSGFNIGQISTNYSTSLNDNFAIQYNVLGATDDSVSANFVTRSL